VQRQARDGTLQHSGATRMQRCTALLHRQKVVELDWGGGGQPAACRQVRHCGLQVVAATGCCHEDTQSRTTLRLMVSLPACVQEAETSRLSPGKIAAIVGVGVAVALLLLLLLFSGDSEEIMESTQPLTFT